MDPEMISSQHKHNSTVASSMTGPDVAWNNTHTEPTSVPLITAFWQY